MIFNDALNYFSQATAQIPPINLVLGTILALLIYYRLRPTLPIIAEMTKEAPATLFRIYTPPELLRYTGQGKNHIYFAVKGKVFDVTAGRGFYGPGGPYANFAGRDASRGLACSSFDEAMLTQDLEGPLDNLADLSEEQISTLNDWEAKFDGKYPIVGKFVAVADKQSAEKQLHSD